jgi:hypothetical protein
MSAESQNFEASKDSRYLGMTLQTTAVPRQWLSSDHVEDSPSAQMEEETTSGLHAGAAGAWSTSGISLPVNRRNSDADRLCGGQP